MKSEVSSDVFVRKEADTIKRLRREEKERQRKQDKLLETKQDKLTAELQAEAEVDKAVVSAKLVLLDKKSHISPLCRPASKPLLHTSLAPQL
jgi:hypothetical protein